MSRFAILLIIAMLFSACADKANSTAKATDTTEAEKEIEKTEKIAASSAEIFIAGTTPENMRDVAIYFLDETGAEQSTTASLPAWSNEPPWDAIITLWAAQNGITEEITLLEYSANHVDGYYIPEGETEKKPMAGYEQNITLSANIKEPLSGYKNPDALLQTLVLTFAHIGSDYDHVLVSISAESQLLYIGGK